MGMCVKKINILPNSSSSLCCRQTAASSCSTSFYFQLLLLFFELFFLFHEPKNKNSICHLLKFIFFILFPFFFYIKGYRWIRFFLASSNGVVLKNKFERWDTVKSAGLYDRIEGALAELSRSRRVIWILFPLLFYTLHKIKSNKKKKNWK